MANNCMNWVNIYGKDRILDKIEKKLQSYEDHKGSFLEWGDEIIDLEPLEYDTRSFYHYGTKWWNFEIERSRGQINVSGDSAWSPPSELIRLICEKYKVSATIEYEEPGSDFGGSMEFDEEGEVVDEVDMTYDQWRYHDSDGDYINCICENLHDNFDMYKDFDDLMKEYHFVSDEHKKEIEEEFNKIKDDRAK